MKTNKSESYGTPEIEGVERQCILFMVPTVGGNATYRCHRWQNLGSHWVLETVNGDQVEVWGAHVYLIHIPKPGFTYELDGTCREVQKTSSLVMVN